MRCRVDLKAQWVSFNLATKRLWVIFLKAVMLACRISAGSWAVFKVTLKEFLITPSLALVRASETLGMQVTKYMTNLAIRPRRALIRHRIRATRYMKTIGAGPLAESTMRMMPVITTLTDILTQQCRGLTLMHRLALAR